MWKTKEAVIFDLDGTIVDSMWVWPQVDIEFLGQHGYELPDDLQRELDGKSFYECAVYIRNRFHLQETEEELMDIWNEMALEMYSTQVKVKPGVEAFLKKIKAAGIKTGIASSNSHVLVEAALNGNGILKYFDSIHTANEVGKGKPAPDIYLLVAEDLGVKPENCLVLISNNRGFCGGFNGELHRFFEQQLAEEKAAPRLIVLGQKGAAFCKANGLDFESIPLEDIPSYSDAEALTAKLFELYASGEANRIILVYQRFENMMTQTPTAETILPHPANNNDQEKEMLYLPDRQTALQTPAMYCLINSIYGILLGHCAGIQAATSIAMRSACDNADKSLERLEILINRIRQSEVTHSVIETSSYLLSE